MTFNQSITEAVARIMQDPSDFVFINMVNINLLRRDSYLECARHGVKVDTVAVKTLHFI